MRKLFHVLAIFFATAAHAQLATPKAQDWYFLCGEKADAYSLSIADIQGRLQATADRMKAEGRCTFLPATYLFTLDTYLDDKGAPSRVVQMMVRGQQVWGILADLPDGVWLISR